MGRRSSWRWAGATSRSCTARSAAGPGVFRRDEEFRLYVVLLAVGSALLVVELVPADLAYAATAVRHGVFQAVSTMTTTGFATADYARWTGLTSVVIVGLMFFGASAGSTTGR